MLMRQVRKGSEQMIQFTCYYKAQDEKEQFGVVGAFQTPEEALKKINDDYIQALQRGYNNCNEKYNIVLVSIKTERNSYGAFLNRTTEESIVWKVKFSKEHGKFVKSL